MTPPKREANSFSVNKLELINKNFEKYKKQSGEEERGEVNKSENFPTAQKLIFSNFPLY